MTKNIDLTAGSISQKIFRFTMPLLGTSFIHMTYSFVDMICIGKLGSGSVAAVGTAGFFMWFGNASSSMARIGTQVLVSRSYGRKDYPSVQGYSEAAFWINLVFGLIVALTLSLGNAPIIGFFQLGDEEVIRLAREYLFIIALSMPFMYVNPVISAMLNSIGNSKLPFIANSTGLIFNIFFDIVLIFGIGPFPAMGVRGAAIATAFAQVFVFAVLIVANIRLDKNIRLSVRKFPSITMVKKVCSTGFPSALQSTLYCCYSIVLARRIALFGPTPIAVQKVGSQIESISWMTADGLAIAATAFIGQNFGVGNFDRIKKGIRIISLYALMFGSIATILLVFFGAPIFSIFLTEPGSIQGGISYLRILGYSQIFMCMEILFIGIYNGHGETRIPALMSILLTGSRIPVAWLLTQTHLGVDGVWWAISGTSIVKGCTIPLSFYLYQKKLKKNKS
ncbi:MAG: MATE family efflux transporter [Peptostreptococcaceae bacterium]|nr:MATE family efflux transporter [Peptostreptococcaceae bacterium]